MADDVAAARAENAAEAERIRSRSDAWGLVGWDEDRHNFRGPKGGTTSTRPPARAGKPSAPVYYDWQANWTRVEQLVRTPAMQRIPCF